MTTIYISRFIKVFRREFLRQFNNSFILHGHTENCPGASVEFTGEEGIFVQGSITPPFEDVLVNIETKKNAEADPNDVMEVFTDKNGAYR